MNKNPKKHRSKKYENPPIPTIKGLTHRGGSNSIYQNHELNYSHMATSHVIRFLDRLFEFPSTQQDTLGSDSGYSQPRVWHPFTLQKAKATKTKNTETTKLQYP